MSGHGRSTKLTVFKSGVDPESERYTYKSKDCSLDAARLCTLKKNTTAWTVFDAEPPEYRKTAIRWIMSGKKDETKYR